MSHDVIIAIKVGWIETVQITVHQCHLLGSKLSLAIAARRIHVVVIGNGRPGLTTARVDTPNSATTPDRLRRRVGAEVPGEIGGSRQEVFSAGA